MENALRMSTRTNVELQRRNDENVAIIEIETRQIERTSQGRQTTTVTNRQVMIVPMTDLPDFTNEIIGALTEQASYTDSWDLSEDAVARYLLLPPANTDDAVAAFYTLAEARVGSAALAGKGYRLAKADAADGNRPKFIEKV